MKQIDYKIKLDGICLTDCPHNVKCKVGSMTCELCLFFIRKEKKLNIVWCNADYLFHQKV